MKKLNTIFMGNPEFCLPALESLHKNEHINLVAICGGLDKKSGRGQKLSSPPTIEFAKENQIHFIQAENINKSETFFSFIEETSVDLIVVFAFSHFLGKRILEAPKLGCFNIHTSILPKYRGSSPIHYSLLNGDKETGVTIQKMVKKMDAGDILTSHLISIDENDDYLTLAEKMQNKMPQVITDFCQTVSNPPLKFTPQNESEVTFAPLINKEDGLINPEKDNFEILKNKIRAFKMWPGVYGYINGKRTKIFKINKSNLKLGVGEMKIQSNQVLLGLKEDSIEISELQFPGKKPQKASDFLNGLNGKLDLTYSMTEEKK